MISFSYLQSRMVLLWKCFLHKNLLQYFVLTKLSSYKKMFLIKRLRIMSVISFGKLSVAWEFFKARLLSLYFLIIITLHRFTFIVMVFIRTFLEMFFIRTYHKNRKEYFVILVQKFSKLQLIIIELFLKLWIKKHFESLEIWIS